MTKLTKILIGVFGGLFGGLVLAFLLSSSAPNMPDEATQVALVQESMGAFADAVDEKTMARFHDRLAEVWQAETSVYDLDKTFEPLLRSNINLGFVKEMTPQFSEPPVIDEDGVLRIIGAYPSEPKRLTFHHTYVYEGSDWKIAGLRVGESG